MLYRIMRIAEAPRNAKRKRGLKGCGERLRSTAPINHDIFTSAYDMKAARTRRKFDVLVLYKSVGSCSSSGLVLVWLIVTTASAFVAYLPLRSKEHDANVCIDSNCDED